MSDSPEPTQPTPPTTRSGGINVGDIAGGGNVDLDMNEVAGRDLAKITNSPGASIGATTNIYEAPRKLTRDEQLAQRNRHTMLLKVKAYWIDGVLANSLHSKVIPLDMERKPDAVTRPRPWDVLWQHRNQQPQPLPPGTKIVDRFNYAAGDALLILGEPGSGKTTMLLELAGELLEWAEQNEALRIPVVFNLSSWAVLRPPLTEWLVSELQTLYLIPKKVAQSWVEQDDILPLLDGLDEVAQEHRAVCIKAINAYREAQGTPLVVCSRIADYEGMGEKLLLSDGLLLRPLTQEQINEYLAAGGAALAGVYYAIQHDETLQEMAQSPLLLSIMAIAYRDHPPAHFTTINPDDRCRQLFVTYLQRQLPQRQKDEREDLATTLRQLAYLAHQMTACNQTIFLIERIQPKWLLTPSQQRFYPWIVRLVSGLIAGLIVCWLTLGLIIAIAVGEPIFELVSGLSFGLLVGLFGGLVFELVTGLHKIEPVEKASWSREYLTQRDVFRGLLFGLIVGLFFGSFFGLVGGLIFGFVVGLFAMLVGGLIFETVELKTTPNEGVKTSAQNAIRIGLGTGLVSGLVFGVVGGLFVKLGVEVGIKLVFRVVGGLIFGLGTGLGVGLVFGLLSGGGLAIIQHYTLRFWLYLYSYLPLNLVPFLDLAAERLILQKVGGGYRFVHRLLQEYLASLYVEEEPQ